MLIDVCSDLHVDFFKLGVASVDWQNSRNQGSDVLVIAGDTANHYDKLIRVLRKASSRYQHIVFVDGNHCHYNTHATVTTAEDVLEFKAVEIGNATYLNGKNSYRYGNTVFVGVNGWYDFKIMCPEYSIADQWRAWKEQSNDAVYIRHRSRDVMSSDWRPVAEVAEEQAEMLRQQVEQFSQDASVEAIVVVTHTAPLRQCLVNRPESYDWQTLSGAYANSAMINVLTIPNHKIKHWIYGHTHNRRDQTIVTNDLPVRFINNSRGYEFEAKRWKLEQFDTEVI